MSIHKKRRKVEACHNCHTVMPPEDNFCPHCGQENHDLKVPLGHIIFEVFEGFTHFDSKFYNTLVAVFTKPGKVTRDFLEGRRARYVPPTRFYFFMAFIFFIFLGNIVDRSLNSPDSTLGKIFGLTNGDFSKRDASKVARDLKKSGVVQFSEEDEKSIKDWTDDDEAETMLFEMNIPTGDTLNKLLDSIAPSKRRLKVVDIQKQISLDTANTEEIENVTSEMRSYFTETIGKRNKLEYVLNLRAIKNNAKIKVNYGIDTVITLKGGDGTLQNTAYNERVSKMSDAELDTLIKKQGNDNNPPLWIARGSLRNTAKYKVAFNDNPQQAISDIAHLSINTISLMMFLLMPLVAFLLKIVYSKRSHWAIRHPFKTIYRLGQKLLLLFKLINPESVKSIPEIHGRKNWLYYEHLIFSIHIHGILFLMIMIFCFLPVLLNWGNSFIPFFLLLFTIYFVLSLKNVYRQGWIKTIVKSFILFFMYGFNLFILLTITFAFKFVLS